MGDFTESCCHDPSKLRQAFPKKTLRVGGRWPGQHHLARPTDYDGEGCFSFRWEVKRLLSLLNVDQFSKRQLSRPKFQQAGDREESLNDCGNPWV